MWWRLRKMGGKEEKNWREWEQGKRCWIEGLIQLEVKLDT
jgi:hypothetical protein